jgi:O-succinylhomoserine sulfhydrylase
MKPQTSAIRIQTKKTAQKEHSTPLFLTSSFTYDSAAEMANAFATDDSGSNIYSRFSNPTVDEFVQKIAVLEGAETGIATATGMAAVFGTFMTFLKAGDHVISASAVFGSTHTILTKYLPKWNIESSYFNMANPQQIESLIKPNTKMLYVETPSNPGLDIVDITTLSKLCKKHKILFVVDNCFATPAVQLPIKYGADLVLHSATKFMDGQGRVLGGVVVGSKKLIKEMYLFIRNTGPSLSPFNAWVLTKSIETLFVRMNHHAASALKLAKSLQNHSKISSVKYPYLPTHPQYKIAKKQMSNGGAIITFELKGGIKSGQKFLNALRMISMTNNLGDSRTIASHPASTTHSKLTEAERNEVGITPGLIRISVGLEHIDDITNDILQALKKS